MSINVPYLYYFINKPKRERKRESHGAHGHVLIDLIYADGLISVRDAGVANGRNKENYTIA